MRRIWANENTDVQKIGQSFCASYCQYEGMSSQSKNQAFSCTSEVMGAERAWGEDIIAVVISLDRTSL